jgi:hypothetical protein
MTINGNHCARVARSSPTAESAVRSRGVVRVIHFRGFKARCWLKLARLNKSIGVQPRTHGNGRSEAYGSQRWGPAPLAARNVQLIAIKKSMVAAPALAAYGPA